MFSLWQKQQKATSDWVQQPRNSSEAEALNPLMDEEGTNEQRYYRSAEFQQALLEKQIEENLTTPVEEQPKRRRMSFSRHHRRGSVESKSSAGHPLFDFEEEQARQAAGIEAPPPAYNTIPPPSYADNRKDKDHAPAAKGQKHRPRIHLSGISPLINFAGKKRNA